MSDREEKLDLLSLSPRERRLVIQRIRAALEERIAEAKVPTFWAFSKDVMIDMPAQLDAGEEPAAGTEDPSANRLSLESLIRRLW